MVAGRAETVRLAPRFPLFCAATMTNTRRTNGYLALALGLVGYLFPEAAPAQWHQGAGARWATLTLAKGPKEGFTPLLPDRTGVRFTNTVTELASAANRILLNGAGLATGDTDGDGLPDLYFCSLSGESRLFRNQGGFRFLDVTREAGVGLPGLVTRGAVFSDIDGDGDLDLLVSTLANGVVCLLNDGKGKFTDFTSRAGTASRLGSVTMALADIDGNGTLDLYVANYRSEDIRDRGQVQLNLVKGQMVVPPKLRDRLTVVQNQVLEFGEPDSLLLNNGQGRFLPASWTDGTFQDEDGKNLAAPPLDWGLTATFRDINGDGFPDLYVCNDYWTPDRIWLNDGRGRFRALPRLALRETSSSSMGVDFADIDRDGHLDFIVTDMLSRDPKLRRRQMPARWPIPEPIQEIEFRPQIIQNTLFHNRGDGTYEEIANYGGVAASDWTWQPLFLDVDLDGYPDLLVSAGHVRDVQDLDAEREIRSRQHSWKGFTNAVEKQKAFTAELMEHMRFYPRLEMPIFAFRNGGRLQFEDATKAWGTDQLGVHHSMAVADFDNDGDLDLVVNNLGQAAGVYRNDSSGARVAVRLKGQSPNTQGIGAKITLRDGAIPVQTQEVICGGSYMSGSDPLLVFAAGLSPSNMTLVVQWRGGRTSRVPGVVANQLYEVDERTASLTGAEAVAAKAATSPTPERLFRDVSSLIGQGHRDLPFDDLIRQPLLPRKLSQLGPGVTWCDVNRDGSEDLVIGSGRGGQLSVFVNDGKGGFRPTPEPPFSAPVTRDQTAVLGAPLLAGGMALISGSSNYEDGLAAGASARLYDLGRKAIVDSFSGQASSTGPLCLADLEGDGDLDLFVGGRCLPGRYPEAAASLVFRQTQKGWELDDASTRTLRGVGLVSGAIWTDLDGDGLPELVLACEWGTIRVFKNRAGQLSDGTAEWGLEKFTGWWSSVAAGDLDGDGRLDLVAANWGLNSPYHASPGEPLRLYYGNFGGGGLDLLEAEFDPVLKAHTPRRRLDALSTGLPFLADRFSSHKAFSEATVEAVLGPRYREARWVEARTLASMAFLNRGNRFEAIVLPREAQWAPAVSAQIADLNGDGFEDVFLSQNFFGTEAEIPRQDAGRGLVLLGDGTGNLQAVPGQESGITIYGEQRGAAFADFDGDGRIDLAVAQNSAALKLFQNAGGKRGLRVRLRGAPGNPDGIGASVRLVFPKRSGPVREIQAGSGYWSQNSSVSILATPEAPTGLWIRWPGGQITSNSLAAASGEITVDRAGQIKAGE